VVTEQGQELECIITSEHKVVPDVTTLFLLASCQVAMLIPCSRAALYSRSLLLFVRLPTCPDHERFGTRDRPLTRTQR
jgi:hypothetical protein